MIITVRLKKSMSCLWTHVWCQTRKNDAKPSGKCQNLELSFPAQYLTLVSTYLENIGGWRLQFCKCCESILSYNGCIPQELSKVLNLSPKRGSASWITPVRCILKSSVNSQHLQNGSHQPLLLGRLFAPVPLH